MTQEVSGAPTHLRSLRSFAYFAFYFKWLSRIPTTVRQRKTQNTQRNAKSANFLCPRHALWARNVAAGQFVLYPVASMPGGGWNVAMLRHDRRHQEGVAS
jgi:hypothetical protein